MVLVILFLLTAQRALACEALPWLNEDWVPECPKEGSSLILPETYPAAAVIIPVRADQTTLYSDLFSHILTHSPEHLPLMVIPGALRYFKGSSPAIIKEKIIKELLTRVEAPETRAALRAKLRSVLILPEGPEPLWTQDVMSSTFDPATGLPILRPIRDYYPHRLGIENPWIYRLAHTIHKACRSITVGDTIPPKNAKGPFERPPHYSIDGESGGNSLGLPGGLYLTGNNQPREKIAAHYVIDPSHLISLPVEWLEVGHVDEIVSVLKDNTQLPPCDFAIAMPSPEHALSLLKDPESGSLRFFTGIPDSSQPGGIRSPGEIAICDLMQRYNRRKAPACRSTSPLPFDETAQIASTACDPRAFTVAQVVEALHSEAGEELLRYNQGIQEILTESKRVLEQKLKVATGCETIKFLSFPNLYFGGSPIKKEADPGKNPHELSFQERNQLPFKTLYSGLPKDKAQALFPNVINSLSIQNVTILPYPHQALFEFDIWSAMENLKAPYTFQDDWAIHIKGGNLHCLSNAIRVCRPQRSRKKLRTKE